MGPRDVLPTRQYEGLAQVGQRDRRESLGGETPDRSLTAEGIDGHDDSRWKVGTRRAPTTVASVADTSSHRKSAVLAAALPIASRRSTRLARSGAWNEFEVRDTRMRMLNNESERAIRPVRLPAIRTEYASVPMR